MHPITRRAALASPFALAATASLRAEDAPPPRLAGPNAPLDGLFLSYRTDPTREVVVQWFGPAADPSAGVVNYKPHPWNTLGARFAGAAPVSIKPYPRADLPGVPAEFAGLHVRRAVLTGLAPGTEYEFCVGTRPVVYRFRTMPETLTDAFHFVSGGDCGLNAHAIANNRVAAGQDPMFALIGGDLGYDNGTSVPVSVQFIRNYAATMVDTAGRLVPLVTCIGNHEVNGRYDRKRADGPFFFALFDELYPERSYATLDFGNYLSLILLDTGHVAPIGGEQADWLDRQLLARHDRPHLIVVNHVPAYPSYRVPNATVITAKGTGQDNRKHWVPLFEKHRVDVVLEHHDHTFKRTHPLIGGETRADGIVYLGDGSWGKLRPAKSPKERPYLAVTSTNYHLTLHRLTPTERFHLALGETGKVLDVTTTAKVGRRHRVNTAG